MTHQNRINYTAVHTLYACLVFLSKLRQSCVHTERLIFCTEGKAESWSQTDVLRSLLNSKRDMEQIPYSAFE